MAKLILNGSTSGSVTLESPAVSGTTTLTLPTTTDTLVGKTTTDTLTNKTLTSPVIAGTPTGVGVLTAGTAVASTSGTSIDFTSIPSWVKRITVMFNGVSTNSSSPRLIQLGDSGGIEATGYLGNSSQVVGGAAGCDSFTTGFGIRNAFGAGDLIQGSITISNLSGNIWVCSGVTAMSNSTVTTHTAGTKELSATLDRIRITTVNGTDTFDAGSINILYE
jgi:hypothetical protein